MRVDNGDRDRYRPIQPGPDGSALKPASGQQAGVTCDFIGFGPIEARRLSILQQRRRLQHSARILNLKPATNDGGSKGMNSVLRK
jgi:hypothetical protein